jgi:hypothetical protein
MRYMIHNPPLTPDAPCGSLYVGVLLAGVNAALRDHRRAAHGSASVVRPGERRVMTSTGTGKPDGDSRCSTVRVRAGVYRPLANAMAG